MYERYCKLRDSKGYKDSDIANGTGINKSTFSDWKSGRSIPKQPKLQKIADFLNVSYEYLTTGKDNRLSDKNAELDFLLLTDNDTRNMLIEYQQLDLKHKKMLLKYLDFLKTDTK